MVTMFRSKKATNKSIVLDPQTWEEQVILDLSHNKELEKQIQMIDLTKHDLAVIRQLQPHIQPHLEDLVTHFYKALEYGSGLNEIIQKNS